MDNFTLTPAYGQDYKSKAEVLADFDAQKDFRNQSFNATGAYVNKQQLPAGATVQFRYGKLRKTFIHKV